MMDGFVRIGDAGVLDTSGLAGSGLAGSGLAGSGLEGAGWQGGGRLAVDGGGGGIGVAGMIGMECGVTGFVGVGSDGRGCGGVDLAGVGSGGVDCGGVDLAGVGSGGVDCGGVDLAGVGLGGVDCGGVDLAGVDLARADCCGDDVCGGSWGRVEAARVGGWWAEPVARMAPAGAGWAKGADWAKGAGAGRVDAPGPVRFAIIIPARAGSRRFPGKPLAMLRGAGGRAKPLIERSWECACAVAGAYGVWVATDDAAIADVVRSFGGQVVMTSAACRNGTERVAEAVARLVARRALDVDIVVNLQGDAPLTPPGVVEALVSALAADEAAAMATAALACSAATYAHLQADAAMGRAGGTTVVTNGQDHALYFSKAVMPFVPAGVPDGHGAVQLHLGIYAYRPAALAAYVAMPPSPLEELEGLEQLRFLEAAAPVRVVRFPAPPWDCIELNNPGDVAVVEANLARCGLE